MRCPFRLRGCHWQLFEVLVRRSVDTDAHDLHRFRTVSITPEMPDRCPDLQRFSYCSLRPLGSRRMPAPCANYDRQIL
jgi:hypothetical protein